MFLGNGAVYAAEPNVTATDSALAATPANNQLDENSGASDSTAPKGQADTTTPAPADASSTSVESSTVSKAQADAATSNLLMLLQRQQYHLLLQQQKKQQKRLHLPWIKNSWKIT